MADQPAPTPAADTQAPSTPAAAAPETPPPAGHSLAPEQTPEQREAEVGKAFDKLWQAAESQQSPPPEAPAGGEPTPPAGEAEAKPTQDPKPTEPKIPDGITREHWEKAIHALRRDGLDADLIDHLSKDPARLFSVAAKAAKRQADIDAKLNELAQLKAARETAPQTTGKPAEATTAPPASGPDPLDALVDPVVALLGEDVKEPLGKLARGIKSEVEAAYKPALEELTNRLRFAEDLVERMALNEARRSLAETYPEVKTDDGWGRVLKQMHKLAPAGFDSFDDLARTAAKVEFGEYQKQREQEKAAEQHRLRANGQPTATGSKPPSRPLSVDDVIRQQMDALAAGDTKKAESLRRLAGDLAPAAAPA